MKQLNSIKPFALLWYDGKKIAQTTEQTISIERLYTRSKLAIPSDYWFESCLPASS